MLFQNEDNFSELNRVLFFLKLRLLKDCPDILSTITQKI